MCTCTHSGSERERTYSYTRFNTKCQVYKCKIFADLIKIFQLFVILYALSCILVPFFHSLSFFPSLSFQKLSAFVSCSTPLFLFRSLHLHIYSLLALFLPSDLLPSLSLSYFLSCSSSFSLNIAKMKNLRVASEEKTDGTKTQLNQMELSRV